MRKGSNNFLIENFYLCLGKWGITPRQLNDAILETGSLDTYIVRDYLVRTKVLVNFWGVSFYSRQKIMGYIEKIFFYIT